MVLGLLCSKMRADNGGFLPTGGAQQTGRTGQQKRSRSRTMKFPSSRHPFEVWRPSLVENGFEFISKRSERSLSPHNAPSRERFIGETVISGRFSGPKAFLDSQ